VETKLLFVSVYISESNVDLPSVALASVITCERIYAARRMYPTSVILDTLGLRGVPRMGGTDEKGTSRHLARHKRCKPRIQIASLNPEYFKDKI
jgi:hypothetical protein